MSRWKRLSLAGIGVVGAALALLGMARGAQFLVDQSLSDASGKALDTALIIMLASAAMLAVSSYLRSTSVNALADHAGIEIQKRVFAHLMRLDARYHAKHASGELVARLTAEIGNIQNAITVAIPNGLRNSLLLAGGLGLMIWTSPHLSLLTMLAVPLLSLPVILLAPRLRRMSRGLSDMNASLGGFFAERIGAVRSVQLFAAEDALSRDLARHHERVQYHKRQVYMTRGLLASLIIMLVFSLIAFILWSGGNQVLEGRMTGGEVAAFVMYAVISAGALATLTETGQGIGQAQAGLERLIDILNTNSALETSAAPQVLGGGVPRIAFENVSFGYGDTPILHDVSFVIDPRETIAIVGPSGAGKSTLFALLTRLYDPQSGRITLDGTDIRDLDPADLRRAFGVIPQEPDVFAVSVRDNIAFGLEDIELATVENAARLANAAPFIDALPQGYGAMLGERGNGLSVGQKQRLAIARALIRDPKILLMDEATSALDAESEKLVQDALAQASRERTAIIIAHRLATIRNAGRILVMERGRIVAIGAHDELMKQGGLYAHLAGLQFLN